MVECKKCGHSWNIQQDDKYPFFCHKCGWDIQSQIYIPMKYKDFFSDLFEAYPWGGFNATKSDFESPRQPDTNDDEITINGPRVSDFVEEEKDGPCWSGYEMIGWKMKNGKKVPNCVPIKETHTPEHEDELHDGEYCPQCLAEFIKQADEEPLQEAEYQGRKVPLGKPMRGDSKKFKVYVKDPKTGNVKKVNFGDKSMRIKKSNPARRKSFRARHNCANPGPRTKARYWSCRKW
jgi:transcription elongation factor Elf1